MSLIYDFVNYNRSFSQLAKESNFTFNLYRGRVDWKKLEVVDIDRIVRDQDVELLNIYMDSVTNCNLDSEYDVKILDPNFIKLFRLAQLLIDFLIHCKKYLEHCIKVAHESLQASNKEVELLRKQLQARKSEVKQLKKKVKEVKNQLLHSPRISNPTFQCSLCGKVFMNESYLHGHYSRRHHSSYCLGLKPQPTPQSPPIKIDKQENEEITNKLEDMTSIKKKYQEEIEELKNMFFAEIEKLKQSEVLNTKTGTVSHPDTKREDKPIKSDVVEVKQITSKELSVTVEDKKQSAEETGENSKTQPADVFVPAAEPTKVPEADKEVEGEWVRRLEEREKVWRARLSALDLQHKKQVQQLEDKLTSSQLQGQEMKKDLERRLEEVLSKFEQSQTLIKSYQLASKNDEIKKNDNTLESTLPSSLSDLKIPSVELKVEKSAKRQSPFQRRKAFVSQKSKTIQDSVEAQQDENLVEILQPDVDSDVEIVSLKAQSNDTDNHISNERSSKEIFEVVEDKDSQKPAEQLSKSKNTEMIVKKLLEEEKQRTFVNKTSEIIKSSIEEDESSITETSTDSESEIESSEDKQNQELQQSGSADRQLLHAESLLAQQSLQSMENLLATNPRILQQLREELQQLLRRRLQGLGVDPSWGGLPPSTFSTKMATLSHQRQITAKNHKIYYTLRDKLSNDANTAVAARRMSADQQTAEDSLLSRLRRKAAQVINATKFTYHMESLKKKDGVTKSSTTQFTKSQPLASSSPKMSSSPLIASSSPQQAASNTSYDSGNLVIPKIQARSAEDTLSLLSSCEEEEEEEDEDKDKQITVQVTAHPKPVTISETGSYKSALRNAVSTGSLAKKKVLFVDEAIKDDKRSVSESTMLASHSVGATRSQSVASLVQEIQQQLGQRSGKPANSVDLLSLPEAASGDTLELPLSQILPLSRSGRELVQGSLGPEPIPATRKRQGMNVLQLPSMLSPPHSISSLASSQLDSPSSNLDWALQDLEDNLRE